MRPAATETGRGPILVIAGPTASGKTAAAIELAASLGGELVGADSVQVYRGFDIGSAKPRPSELRGVSHHLIDVVDPDEEIDAVGYAALADAAIEAVSGRGRLPIVVGGTGLWLRALSRGLVDVPPVDPALRARLEGESRDMGPEAAHRRLSAVDPLSASKIHPNDLVRITRALEVFEQTGRPLGELRAAHALGAPRYDALFLVLDVEPGSLKQRIADRIGTMIEAGWVEEVRGLVAQFGPEVRALGSVGYREMLAHVTEGVQLEETIRQIRRSTWVYARRQRNWFRAEPGVDQRSTAEQLVSAGGREQIAAWLRARPRPG